MTRLSEAADRDMRHRPVIYALVCRFTQEVIDAGYRHYTIKGIFERIRWHVHIESRDHETGFKLSNNHHPYYARRWMREHNRPGFFRTRPVLGGDRGPKVPDPILTELGRDRK